jgi:hypothetical protein
MIVRRVMRNLLPRPVALRVRREWLARRLAAGKGHFEDDVALLSRYVKPTDVWARQLLARRRPVWLLETFDDAALTCFRSLGYSARVRDASQQLVEVTARVDERNYWLFPAS